jgi:hypothetical protein
VAVAAIAIGAASRPHSVELSLSAPELGEVAVLAVLVLAGALGLLLGANRYPIWVVDPNRAMSIRVKKSRLPWAARTLLFLLPFMVLAFLIAASRRLADGSSRPAGPVPAGPLVPVIPSGGSDVGLFVACVAVALTAALVGAALFRNPGSAARPPRASTQEAAAEILDEGLGALLAERDPRRAVIAAYVAMERSMARRGWARRPHEAPTEYLARVLGVAPSRARDLDELVGLYEFARFSEHDVTASMRDAAVDSVRRLRAELREPV